jgi:hypothetical protein
VDRGLLNDAASTSALFGLELCYTGGGTSHVPETEKNHENSPSGQSVSAPELELGSSRSVSQVAQSL